MNGIVEKYAMMDLNKDSIKDLSEKFSCMKVNDDDLDELCNSLDKLDISESKALETNVDNDSIGSLCVKFMDHCKINNCNERKVIKVVSKILMILSYRRGRCYVNNNHHYPTFVY